MTSFNLRFITPFAVAAELVLVLVACGNKVELTRTEAEAIAYTKRKDSPITTVTRTSLVAMAVLNFLSTHAGQLVNI